VCLQATNGNDRDGVGVLPTATAVAGRVDTRAATTLTMVMMVTAMTMT